MSIISINPMPQLPWDWHIEAAIEVEDVNVVGAPEVRTFIVTSRDDPMPYVVYELLSTGACHHGDYCETLGSAIRLLYDRAARAHVD